MKPERSMVDGMGREVPIRYVSAYDRVRDREVRAIVADWLRERARLEEMNARTLERVMRIVDARKDTGKDLADKGNFQESTFDNLQTVALDVRYDIHLDDRVRAARDMLYEYVRGLAGRLEGDDGKALMAILDETFRATQDGRLSSNRVLSLMRMKVTAPAWVQGMQMLRDSIDTRKGKSYLRVTIKPSRQHDPEAIRLDIADCWPRPKTEPEGAANAGN